VRDVRGFATKFYTEAGNYDLVGNNFPVFFIQDGIKFPDRYAMHFVTEAYEHLKVIGAFGAGVKLLPRPASPSGRPRPPRSSSPPGW